jgi:eukaryotic-like serine/threonine-protein kinase
LSGWPEPALKNLGKYEVLGELGRGAMGIVYRARDPMINRLVALKTITTGVADDPALLERFYREAQSAGGLQHPNIVTIYDLGQAGAHPYIAMEVVEGENLEQLIARRAELPVTVKLDYAMQACRAFDFAHKRGIVHRDIKPGNVMVSKEGTVKVVDFGIARILETSRTQTGMLIGTFAYMSPEQYHGEHADERSDIWSFGVLVYELLSYQRPFAGLTPASLMHSICNAEPIPLSTSLADCPEELQRTVAKMLCKSPAERYESMEDVLLDLDPICKALQSQSVGALLEQSRRLLEQGSFAEARDAVRQALQLDSGNQQARALLEKANAGLKRIQNRPKAQQLVEKGQALLEKGKLQEAKAAAESALQLDSTFQPAESLQRAIQSELEHARLIAEWLDAARQHLAEGLPDDAESLLAKVLEMDPRNAQVQTLQQLVLKEKTEREKSRHLLGNMQQARELWTRQEYGECIKLLQGLRQEFPEDEEVTRLLETVREDQIGQQKQQTLLQSRHLLAAGRHSDALSLLTDLQTRFPNDEEIRGLLVEVRKDELNQYRSVGLAQARVLLAAGQFDACVSVLTSLNKTFPEETEIAQLLESAHQTQAEQLRQAGIAEAGKLLDARQYKECLDYLATLEKQFPGDDEILTLQRAVREQQAEQEKQQRLEEARRCLGARRYDEAVTLLAQLQADFPSEPEITKLLASAGENLDEERKQQKLTEARGLLAAQSFREALLILDGLSAAHPKDHGVVKLRELARLEQEKHSRGEKIQQELDALKQLMREKKYAEVIVKTKELLAEFPSEPNFIRLAEFATSRQANIEKELLFSKILEEAKAFGKANRFEEAIRSAQEGLKTFPGNAELQALRDEAEIQRKKLQVRQQIEQRVREIKVKINREQLSDAIDLAKQTLQTLGPDTDLTHLLSSAEIEFQAREKKRIEERTLETIRTQVATGDLDGASQTINEVLESHTLDSFDPRIQRIANEIKDARDKITAEPALNPPSSAPILSKEYAFLQAAPLPDAPEKPVAADSSAAQALASSAVVPAYVAPAISGAPVLPAPEQTVASLPAQIIESEVKPAVLSPSAPARVIEADQVSSSAVLPATVKTQAAERPAAARSKFIAVALTILAIVIASAIWIGLRSRKPSVESLEMQQRQSIDAANGRIAANDLDGALKILQQAEALNGPLTTEVREKLSEVEKSKSDADLRGLRLNEQQLWVQAKGLVDAGSYTDARQVLKNILALPPGGVHRTDAQQYLDKTIPQLQAQQYLAQGDFQSARRAADVLKQNGGNPADLIAKIDQAELHELGKLKNQFDQLKQRNDSLSIQGLQALQPKFQALAGDGGPQSREAQSYADNIPAAIAGVEARQGANAKIGSTSPKRPKVQSAHENGAGNKNAGTCAALTERAQLGDTLSEEERAYLKDNCH